MPHYRITCYRDGARHVIERRALNEQEAYDAARTAGYTDIVNTEIRERPLRNAGKYAHPKAILYQHLGRALQRKSLMSRTTLSELLVNLFPESDEFREHAKTFLQAATKKPFWQAMNDQPEVFDDYEVAIMHTAVGKTEGDMLLALARNMTTRSDTSKKTKRALVMPVTVFVATIVLVLYILLQGIPSFLSIFHSTDNLGEPTKTIYGWFLWAREPLHTMLILLLFLIPIGLAGISIVLFPGVRYQIDVVRMKHLGYYSKIIRTSREIIYLTIYGLMLVAGQGRDVFTAMRDSAMGPMDRRLFSDVVAHQKEGARLLAHHLLLAEGVFSPATIPRLEAAEDIGSVALASEEAQTIAQELAADMDWNFEAFTNQINVAALVVNGALLVGAFSLYLFPLLNGTKSLQLFAPPKTTVSAPGQPGTVAPPAPQP